MSTAGAVGRIVSDDLDEFTELVKPWEVTLRQMSPGPFRARLDCIRASGILIYREHGRRCILGTGATPEGYFMLGSALSPRIHFDWCGGEATPRHLAYGRPASEVDFVTADDSHHVVVLVATDLMRSYFGKESIEAALSSNHHHLECDAQRGCDLIARVDRMLSRCLTRPELLADDRKCKAIESQLLKDLAEVFGFGNTKAHGARPRARRKAFRRAIELSESLNEPTTVPEFAAAIGVSQRTLQLAFQETIGISPRRYLLWRRMQKAHHELRTKDPAFTSVTEVASRWGFGELGRFAVEYRCLYGKSPSATLRERRTATRTRLSDFLPDSRLNTTP